MRRAVLVLFVLVLVGVSAWLYFGGIERVTASRIERTLVARGIPEPMAGCMAVRMADRLSLAQLRRLERLGPDEGESAEPRSAGDLLARLRRVDDPEAVQIAATAAAVCAFGAI